MLLYTESYTESHKNIKTSVHNSKHIEDNKFHLRNSYFSKIHLFLKSDIQTNQRFMLVFKVTPESQVHDFLKHEFGCRRRYSRRMAHSDICCGSTNIRRMPRDMISSPNDVCYATWLVSLVSPLLCFKETAYKHWVWCFFVWTKAPAADNMFILLASKKNV